MADVVPEIVYTRVDDVLWRLAPDRVLLRHAGAGAGAGDDAAADLMGLAALVWVALDEPATASELVHRLAEEDLDSTIAEVGAVALQLVEAGWAREDVVGA